MLELDLGESVLRESSALELSLRLKSCRFSFLGSLSLLIEGSFAFSAFGLARITGGLGDFGKSSACLDRPLDEAVLDPPLLLNSLLLRPLPL